MIKKKLLLVSPFPQKDSYPHLSNLVDELSVYYEIDYVYVHERGVWIEEILWHLKKNLFRKSAYAPFYNIIKDLITLYRMQHNQYDTVLAVDNFIYVMTALIFQKKTILWSHDFVTYDQKKHKSKIHQFIAKLTKQALAKNTKLIIQDGERLRTLLRSLEFNDNEMRGKTFFLPVSLNPAKTSRKNHKLLSRIDSNVPTLMQIGGINSIRSGSDELIKFYQQNFDDFELMFHGFVSTEIQKLLREVEILPFVSSVMVPADQISQLVDRCDIGFINYVTDDLNFYYMANASGQLVEFIRCGKPVIVKGNNDLRRCVEEKQIGVGISTVDELVPAIHRIQVNYSDYSSNCRKTFDELYNLKSYMKKLLLYLEDN